MGFGISLTNTAQGATAGEYLDRLALNNRIFGVDVRLERVLKHSAERAVIVTSQPNAVGRPATPEEIRAMMVAKGFEELAPAVFYHPPEAVLVHDLAPRNVVFTQGRAVPSIPCSSVRLPSLQTSFESVGAICPTSPSTRRAGRSKNEFRHRRIAPNVDDFIVLESSKS